MRADQLPVYSREYIETLLSVSKDAIVFLDMDFNIHRANLTFYRLFDSNPESKSSLFELDTIANRSELRKELQTLSLQMPILRHVEVL